MMPRDLILVRHGESEGNVANSRSRAGDDSDFTPEFLGRHSAHWRLTDKGCEQAKAVGEWLKANGLTHFDRHYVSECLRAMETAALLGLPDAEWFMDFQLRERDYGLMDIVTDTDRKARYAEYLTQRERHLLFAPLPGGEPMAPVCDRLRGNIVSTLHRELADKRVIIVSHGDVMRAFRIIFERITADEYHALDQANEPSFRIGNGQIIHYTRVNPTKSTRVLPYFGWVRSINPTQPEYAGHDWRAIVRKRYNNAQLLAMVKGYPRLIQG